MGAVAGGGGVIRSVRWADTRMRQRVRLVLFGVVGLVVFPGLALLLLLSHQPRFYVRVGQLTPEQTAQGNDQFHHQASRLTNQILNETRFDVTFTEDQVNAWLTGEAAEKYADRMPDGIDGARIAFGTGRIAVGAHLRRGPVSSIASIYIEPAVLDGTAVALRVRRVRAGALPMPASECRRLFQRTAGRGPFEWRDQDGDPCLVFRLSPKQVRQGMRIEHVVVQPGTLQVQGITGRRHPAVWPNERPPATQPTPVPSAQPQPTIINSIGMKLVYIKTGSFMMGSPTGEEKREDDGGPQHRVTITKGFYLGACEVTEEQYEKVMGSHFRKGGNYPVNQVGVDDAQEFCKKLSAKEGKTYRLPTEAEWEYACRAGTTTAYCFGNSDSRLGAYAWYWSNADNTTHPVGAKQPNAWGLYDMHGNVYEWCQDWYAKDYYARSPQTDPQGPSTGEYRVLRGGSWLLNASNCRSAARVWVHPEDRIYSSGFRVLLSPRPSE